eukprot:CAMPEP_0172440744 /NCGR_PEP_ID=MMETSP1065-20121228/1361_1 /TAXON_ID=265537 /ORGANISM="Amphiprora paludosa, Strain CCMP125" /LENGTH=176 /DNA_ID=CAMNT_0013189735 /DNA_START=34 /DNA_END=564 /DNA_ORIENTATION=-
MDYYQEKGAAPSVQTLRMDTQVLKSLIFCSTILGMKYLVSVMATMVPNRLAGEFTPEDKPIMEMIFGKNIDKEKYAALKERFTRVVANDQESIPAGLAMLWIAGLVSSSSVPTSDNNPGAVAQSIITFTRVFTVSRIAHSACYYAGVAGMRSVAFLGGYFSSMGAGIVALKGLAGL